MNKLGDVLLEKAENLLDAVYTIPNSDRPHGKLCMRRETFERMRRLTDPAGNPLVDHWNGKLELDETRWYVRGVVIEAEEYEPQNIIEVFGPDD